MFASRSLLFIGIFCVSGVISEKVVCDFEDSKCLTESAGLTFEQLISGIPGVESSEPLYAKLIEANHPTLKYKYFDAKLSGMKKCKVEMVKISAKDLKYDYHVGCPHLTLEGRYEINGEVGPQRYEGQGDAKLDFYDVLFLFHGDYVGKDGQGGKSHIHLQNHEMEVQVKEKVVFDFKNLFNGDKEKLMYIGTYETSESRCTVPIAHFLWRRAGKKLYADTAHKHANENWAAVAKMYGKETLEPFMTKYIGNVNAYLDVVPVQDLFSHEK